MRHFDIVIVGGGMIGASLALALGNSRYQVALLEAVPPAGSKLGDETCANRSAKSEHVSFNERMTATSPSSQTFFDTLNCWDELTDDAAHIRRIHVSTAGRFGTTQLRADELDVPSLGFNVPNQRYGAVLFSHLAALDNVHVFCPAKLVGLDVAAAEHTELRIEKPAGDAETLSAKLVVAADGARSTVRDLVAIAADIHDYQQSAIVTAISSKRPHGGTAFERFTTDGPLALLPADNTHRSTVVYTVARDELDAHLSLSDAAFTELVQQRLGWRLGRLGDLGKRLHYPLYRVLAAETVRDRLVVIGNAAHNLHPVAGQGFNLGLRDVATLAEVLVESDAADPGMASLLADYQQRRVKDQNRFAQLTHGLDKLFANDNKALSALRGLGLSVFDVMPAAKRRFLQVNLGQDAQAPKLSRGIALR